MKTKRFPITASLTLIVLILALLGSQTATSGQDLPASVAASPAGTAFTYQGQLKSEGEPHNGACDFQFGLWDGLSGGTQIGTTQTKTGVSVTDGFFALQLDFGAGAFQGEARWLAMSVRCPAGTGDYTPLIPRQLLTPAPYALYAPGAWRTTGNAGTTPGTNYLGTSDNVALELKVNGARALRLEPNASSPNLIGGHSGNWVTSGVAGATIGGGGEMYPNRVTDDLGTVGGGWDNQAGDDAGTVEDAWGATVAGGGWNIASGHGATVGGGLSNTASSDRATVGGGSQNVAGHYAATVSGGEGNIADGYRATIGGGYSNTASGPNSTVAGGMGNTASGDWATVGGGDSNTAGGPDATVGGGENNTASGNRATIGGGSGNTADGEWSPTISGGENNIASGNFSAIGGGEGNIASSSKSTVAGGDRNSASSMWATVAGGQENTASGEQSTIGGGQSNTASSQGATVSGGWDNNAGGSWAAIGGGSGNTASGGSNTIAGGSNNTATAGGLFSAIGGGEGNTTSASKATIAGGDRNTASAYQSTVGGGVNNIASGDQSTIGGGMDNTAMFLATVSGGQSNTASGDRATIGGGSGNTASGDHATVPGGGNNLAQGTSSFAAGTQAKAYNQGCFVWGDSFPAEVPCNVDNGWVARAGGGVHFYTDGYLSNGVYVAAGGNSWNGVSDRAVKENLTPADGQAILETLAALPVQEYNLKSQDPSIRHIGPVAQDFAAFGYGESDTAINMQDADGVALAAIQALYGQVQTLQAENADLESRVAALEAAADSGGSARPWQWGLLPGLGLLAFGLVWVARRGGDR